MSVQAATISEMARGELNTICVDWGENTAGQETGCLKASDTVASCVVAVDTKPTGATDPTLGAVSVNVAALIVNGRSCSAGEATTCNITMAGDQATGMYRLKLTATTTNGKVIPRFVRVNVTVP